MNKQRCFKCILLILSIAFCISSCTAAPLFETRTPADVEPTLNSTTLTVPTLTFTPPVVAYTDTPVDTIISPTNASLSGCVELLTNGPWILEGAAFNAVEPSAPYQWIDENALQGKGTLQIKIIVNAVSFGEGDHHDESAIIIDQPPGHWMVASLAAHGLKAENGEQVIYINLSDFEGLGNDGNFDGTHLDLSDTHPEYGPLHARFWNDEDFIVEISSIMACSS